MHKNYKQSKRKGNVYFFQQTYKQHAWTKPELNSTTTTTKGKDEEVD